MDYNININKICRICLEEGVLTSIFNTEFAMMPADMLMLCAKIKVYKNDGLPPVICNNCIYRLGAAYHFKQQCENSDIRLRQYLGLLDKGYCIRDNETMTDETMIEIEQLKIAEAEKSNAKKRRARNRYKRKLPEEKKKRGPKPQPKIPQTCYECHKTFKCAAQLQMHIRTHTGERPFTCNYCPRRFAQKHNLAIHVRTHTREHPFQCEICGKQFTALGNFQAHKKIHAGIRDQICPVCNKGFITSGDLSRHVLTHTGIKNHHCDVCGKSFSRNRDMVAHKKKIHLNDRHGISENYKCPECHKVFATAANLNTHFRSHNNSGVMAPTHHPGPLLDHIHSSNGISSSLSTQIPPAPIAPTAISGTLGPPIGIGLHPPPPSGLGMLHSQGSLTMMHPQRLHPY